MKTKLVQHIGSLALLTALSAGLLMGCKDTDYPAAQPSTTSFLTTAKALIVNASNAAGITTLIENTAAGTTLAPGANTGYLVAPVSAANQIRVVGSGGTLGSTDYATKVIFLNNTNYTLFVTDSITRPLIKNAATNVVTDGGGIRVFQVTDTLTAPAAGTAKVRFFNFAPDVTGVAPFTVAAAASARLVNSAGASAVTLTNRAYRTTAAATLRYTVVPAGPYVAQVYSGTAVPALTVTPAASATVTLTDGKIYTIYSRGIRRNGTLAVGTVQHN